MWYAFSSWKNESHVLEAIKLRERGAIASQNTVAMIEVTQWIEELLFKQQIGQFFFLVPIFKITSRDFNVFSTYNFFTFNLLKLNFPKPNFLKQNFESKFIKFGVGFSKFYFSTRLRN